MKYATYAFSALAASLVLGCSAATDDVDTQAPTVLASLPASIAPYGDGYPEMGDPCRNVGETDKTRPFLERDTRLVGCPSVASAEALGAKIVDSFDGVYLVAVPYTLEMEWDRQAAADAGSDDMKVPGTEFHATAQIKCDFSGKFPTSQCEAGIVRNWDGPGQHLVRVQRPGKASRAIFYDGVIPVNASGVEADGSAGWDFEVESRGGAGGEFLISYGPERYLIPEGLILQD